MTTFFDLQDTRVGFCGVDNNTFCVVTAAGERLAFEVVEDPDDGYRSALKEVVQVPLDGLIFFAEPVVTLTVRSEGDNEKRPQFDGDHLVDDDGHIWLRFGTDHYDDYYPSFTFEYDPPKTVVGCQAHDDCRTNAEMGLSCKGPVPLPTDRQVKP